MCAIGSSPGDDWTGVEFPPGNYGLSRGRNSTNLHISAASVIVHPCPQSHKSGTGNRLKVCLPLHSVSNNSCSHLPTLFRNASTGSSRNHMDEASFELLNTLGLVCDRLHWNQLSWGAGVTRHLHSNWKEFVGLYGEGQSHSLSQGETLMLSHN